MPKRSSRHRRSPPSPRATADDKGAGKGGGTGRPDDMLSLDAIQVVRRKCTMCEWEAQLVEAGVGEDPLCPWCYGPTARASVIGNVVPEDVRPGQKNPYAASLGRLGGLKGGPARAEKLTAKQRRDIAQKAARARWGKTKKKR